VPRRRCFRRGRGKLGRPGGHALFPLGILPRHDAHRPSRLADKPPETSTSEKIIPVAMSVPVGCAPAPASGPARQKVRETILRWDPRDQCHPRRRAARFQTSHPVPRRKHDKAGSISRHAYEAILPCASPCRPVIGREKILPTLELGEGAIDLFAARLTVVCPVRTRKSAPAAVVERPPPLLPPA